MYIYNALFLIPLYPSFFLVQHQSSAFKSPLLRQSISAEEQKESGFSVHTENNYCKY